MKKEKKNKLKELRSRSGFWIMLVAAVVLESTACIQYFSSQHAIKTAADKRAENELRKAELKINVVSAQLETAVKMMAKIAEFYIDKPDSMYNVTRGIVHLMGPNLNSAGIAFVENYYPSKGKWFEVCTSRERNENGEAYLYTRSIGSADHDYFQLEWFHNGLTIDSCWWSEPYFDDAGARQATISCSYPIRNKKGEVVGVALVDLPLGFLKKEAEHLQIFQDSYYSITSNAGKNIIPEPDTIPGRKYYISEREVACTGWRMAIIIPDDVLYADLRRLGLLVTILMLIGLAFLAFILYYAGNIAHKLIKSNAENQRMENELEVAQTIQMAMLPKVFPPFADHRDLNVYGRVTPAKEVGGDLYDFYVREERLFFCVGDVSGKGVPASLVMATTRSLFRSVTAHQHDAAMIATEMNNSLSDTNDQNMFITLFVGVLELESGKLQYCNAGHNAPVILRQKDNTTSIEMLDVLPNLPVGIMADFPYQAQETTLAYNDFIFLYTDGLTEAENKDHAQFGDERMLESLRKYAGLQPRQVVDGVQADVATFVGDNEQSDDLTMLAIRYQQAAIVMRNDIQQIPTLAEWVDWLNLPMELSMSINLALEEAVVNVMEYAYPKDEHGQVMVEAWRSNGNICFAISDSGVAFDPTQQKEADTTLSAEERPIGGLGIFLVNQLMDSVTYERKDDKNILLLVKKL